jgi:hypothetical protein
MTTAAYSPVASDPIGALIVNVQYGPDDLGHATVVLTRKQMLFGTLLIWVQPFVLTLVAVLPLFEGETVPLCTSGAPFIQSYGISPLHEE